MLRRTARRRNGIRHGLNRYHRPIEPLDARVLLTGDVFATVLHDLNANGQKDPEEPGLQGWTIFVDYDRDGSPGAGEPSAVTDIDGECFIHGIPADTWDVRQILPPGWGPAPGNDVVQRVLVRDNETTDVLYMNIPIAAGGVLGTVWNDINGDGVRGASDPGLPGWTVFVDLNDDRNLDPGEPSDATDATGAYQIGGVAAGDYRVREILQPGWETTIGHDAGVNVTIEPAAFSVVDFGNFNSAALGEIAGTVWNDINGDGIRAAGDPGLEGWTVFVDDDGDSVLDPTERFAVSDGLGAYSIPSIVAGTYRLVEELQPGWTTSPGYPAVRTVAVTGDNTTSVHFANFTPTLGTISGRVWNDLNGNGVLNAGEPGIAGWTVFVDLDEDGLPAAGEPSAISDAGGLYAIAGVPIGSVLVREVAAIGWRPTAPGTGMQLVNVPNGGSVGNVNFGNQQRVDASIRGTAYVDSDEDHVRDPGERGLAGLTVYLDLDDDGVLDPAEPQTVTAADLFYTPAVDEAGSYSFTHLSGGAYRVREILPAVLSGTLEGDRSRSVNLLPGEDRTGVDFANRFRGNEIRGIKYNDLNANHQRDPGEPGVPNVTIYLDIDRDNVLDAAEPRTRTGPDGRYVFATNLTPGAYVVREIVPFGYTQTYPTTTAGTLWPTGVSNPAFGNVSPTSITASLAEYQPLHQTVSLTLPTGGALTNLVDVFLLFDDTGSFTANSPIVRAAFPQIISSLQAALPGIDLAFGVGRFEEYANFAAEYGVGRPFVLNQPIVAASTPGFATAIQSALDRTAPGYGGDLPETVFEALFQTVTGRGFDGNDNGTVTDSGAAGMVGTQLTPGISGDVPPFSSYTVDPAGNLLPAAGQTGGAGFRAGALPIVLVATDTGFAFQPRGETSITGVDGLTLPVSALTQASRGTTPFSSGAGIQETITALGALGALVIGLGTNGVATADPRQGLEAIAKLTGAINRSLSTIPNGTVDPIAPGDPMYFQISSGFAASVSNGIVAAVQNAVASVAVNLTLKATDPRVHVHFTPTVVNGVGAGEVATFNVTFTGDGRPHRFDLQFVREGTEVVLGSIPVVLGTPIEGEGWEFEDLDEGEIDDTVDFGNMPTAALAIATNFEFETGQGLVLDFNHDVLASLQVGDLQVTSVPLGTAVALQAFTYDPLTFRATVRFDPSVLSDGTYRLTIPAGAIANLASEYSFDFFVLGGDANRDRTVNIADFAILASRFNLPGTFSQGDFDYDGQVGIGDFAILASRFNLVLAEDSGGDSMRGAAPSPAAGTAARVPFAQQRRVIEIMDEDRVLLA